MLVPEVLSPAGNLEKLKLAIKYGANAVYLGLQKFGLRSAADNFTLDELYEGCSFAKENNADVYVVLNAYLHDKELKELPEYLKELEKAGVNAVIVSDLGVIETVKQNSNLEVHLSTQASCLNVDSAKLWKDMGVTRVVLGREVNLSDASAIKKATGLEIEMFIHGSMCMAYSGNCVISNFTQGRDSNRGGCAHSCRFEYSIDLPGKENKKVNSFFMSSKDLNGLQNLPEFFAAEIDSIKVEGRMKNHHYVGTISKVYSEAVKEYKKNNKFSNEQLSSWQNELNKLTHREYTNASLIEDASENSVYRDRERAIKSFMVAAKVVEVVENDYILLHTKSSIEKTDQLELIPFQSSSIPFKCNSIQNIYGEELLKANPNQLVKLPYIKGAESWNIIRKAL